MNEFKVYLIKKGFSKDEIDNMPIEVENRIKESVQYSAWKISHNWRALGREIAKGWGPFFVNLRILGQSLNNGDDKENLLK